MPGIDPQDKAHYVRQADMLALGRALLERAGAPPGHALIVMEHLLASSAMGLHSHGVMRIPQYLSESESEIIEPSAAALILQTSESRLAIEARRGCGPCVG